MGRLTLAGVAAAITLSFAGAAFAACAGHSQNVQSTQPTVSGQTASTASQPVVRPKG